ncbi:MAG: tetratricopeptide repeat-containing sensor histidine kinase [Salinivirgaceae bacterium]|nr:tetratricopeptide repeat-containing sensor histidine kinase [Salinivirgaceae bacterium]
MTKEKPWACSRTIVVEFYKKRTQIMKELKSFFLLLFSCFFVFVVTAQNKEIDSLENLLVNHPENDTVKINLLNEMAKKYLSIDLDRTLQYATQADSLSELINFKKGKSISLQLVGNYCFYKQNVPKALENYLQALKIGKEIKDKSVISYCYNYTGNIYLSTGDYTKALEFYQKALKVFKEIDDEIGISGIYNNLGNIYYMQGDYPKTLEYFQKALKIFEELNNKIGISGSYNNMGVVSDEQGNYTKALEYYKKALVIRKELDDKYGISDIYTNIGNIYYVREDHANALEYFQKALEINNEIDSKYGISISYLNIGIIYQTLDNYNKSIECYQKSIAIAREIGSQNMIAVNNIEFSEVYFKLKNYILAIQYGEKGYRLTVELGEKENIKKASNILAKCYAATGNFQKAYSYHVEYKNQSDSLFNESNIQKITNLENQYAFDKEKEAIATEQAKKDIIQAEELEHQKVVRNSFIMGFMLMIVFAFVIFRNLAQKRKANLLLAEQKEEIENQSEELKTTNDKLIELDHFKQGLTSMIVHDLKNPLSGILNISKSYSAENQVVQMKQMGKQMLNMVLNILDVNKFEDSQMIVAKASVSLAQIAHAAMLGISFLARQKNLTINNAISPTIAVNADREIIERVFTNLLTNAIKYTPNNGKISLQAEITDAKQKFVKISVSDTGDGIPQDKLHLVFAKFGQVSAKKSGSVRSTGLGLTFCKMAVEAHKGEINVKSEFSKGTTFWFTLQTANNKLAQQLEKSVLEGTVEKVSLNADEKEILIPYIAQFEKTEIYKMLELRKILRQITTDNVNIQKWKSEIRNAIGSGNQERYDELLNI